MNSLSLWRSATYVKLASAMTLIVATSACASNRVAPKELSQEKVESAFNEENWDTYRSDRQVRTLANKKTFKDRVRNAKKSQSSSVAGR